MFDNVGNVQNKGVEVALTTVNIDSRRADGFRWTTTLNVGINRNKVTALFNGQPFNGGERDINRVQVGQPIGAFYTLHFQGVDPATGDAIYRGRERRRRHHRGRPHHRRQPAPGLLAAGSPAR